jgi:hypothetical protein
MAIIKKVDRKVDSYLDYLYDLDYSEKPVSMEELLSSEEFFGSLTNGGRAVYPIWKEKLGEVMAEDSRYLVVLTGAIGIGKTRAAVWGIASVMQRILCLKNPWNFFGGKTGGGKMAIVFFNLTKSLSESRGFGILQKHLLSSPWFCKRGILVGKDLNRHLEFPLFEYRIASPYAQGFSTIGQDVIIAVMDEVDAPTVSEKQKIRVLQAYDGTVRRFESRFVDDTFKESMGKFFLVASKQEDLSFLNTFVEERKNSPSVFVVDLPYWAIRHKDDLSGNKFMVMLGDVYVPSRIIDTPVEKDNALRAGFKVIDIPVEYKESFERDIIGALRDVAGISTVGLRRSKLFPSEKLLVDCYDITKKDPVNITTVVLGMNDDFNLIKFLDLSKIRIPKTYPRYIHEDIAYSGDGDCLSLAMSCVKEWVKSDVEQPDGSFRSYSVPVIETDFVIRFKGRPGDEVPLYRVRKLILDLRSTGFNVRKFTADLALLSADTKQILEREHILCDYLSVDRTPEPYISFRDLVHEGRWICHKNNMLHFELSNLEYDKDKQKIDHPDKIPTIEFLDDGGTRDVVMVGSKDMSDATVGSVYSAIQDSPAQPITLDQVKTIAEVMRKTKSSTEENWVLDQDKISSGVNSGGIEQYQLVDDQGRYYAWTRNGVGQTPELRGPFTEKMLNLQPIHISNPVTFSPEVSGKPNLGSDSKFVDLIKVARGG